MSIHTASHIDTRLPIARVRVTRVRPLGLGLASQASRVLYLPGIAIHTATGEANRVSSISRTF